MITSIQVPSGSFKDKENNPVNVGQGFSLASPPEYLHRDSFSVSDGHKPVETQNLASPRVPFSRPPSKMTYDNTRNP